jgi:dinuclear metal center YbgI/SA1388 family protein
MVKVNEIKEYLDKLLYIDEITDYCPKGLQIEGVENISKVIGGVSISVRLIEDAIKANAQMIIVHHGLFWDGSPRTILKNRDKRIYKLIKNDINLFGYHLPLDAHNIHGNNISILKKINATQNISSFSPYKGTELGFIGEFDKELSLDQFSERVKNSFDTPFIFIKHGPSSIKRVGVISGGGSFGMIEAIQNGCDVFISGEIKEPQFELSLEQPINLVQLGHYNSEKLGVINLLDILKQEFKVDIQFIDLPNPF